MQQKMDFIVTPVSVQTNANVNNRFTLMPERASGTSIPRTVTKSKSKKESI